MARPREASLRELLVEVLDRIEDEGPAVLEALCAEHPEHASALRQRIAQLHGFGLMPAGTPAAVASVPERLGGFRLLEKLGGGGMGVVFLAEQEGLGRRVALKLVRPDLLFLGPARERFKREVEAVARLSHPGIVPVYAGGEDAGIPWYAMELVRGASLEEVLAALGGRDPARLAGADLRMAVEAVLAGRGPAVAEATDAGLPRGSGSSHGGGTFDGTWSNACLRVAVAVAEALDHAHERGVLHRDVKPGNILVTPSGRVQLLDFGLASAEGSERLTSSGADLGSLAWMSPEQVRGEHATLDARTDVYSLGATLFELLTLRTPFARGGVEDTRRRILEGRPLPLRGLNPAVPRDVETVCLKALEVDRARRYAGAADFGADLRAALERRPIAARRPSGAALAWRWSQRKPAAAAALVLGALVVLGGPLGYGVVQGRAARTEKRLNDDLKLVNASLDTANAELAERSAELQRALAAEQAERAQAQRSFGRSLAAVDEMLATVGASDLRDVPAVEPVRRRLLERALTFYAELEAEHPDRADVRVEQARTHRSMADLQRELGRTEEADALYVQAIAELRALAAAPDAGHDAHHTLASVLGQYAGLCYVQGRFDDARAAWDESRRLLEPLASQQPPHAVHLHDLATAFDGLGLCAHAAGDQEAALDFHRRAAATMEPAARDTSADPVYRALRAASLQSAASMAGNLGRVDEARTLFAEAWATLEALTAGEATRSVRNSAVECASNYGTLLLTGADRALAESVLRRGFELGSALARDFPEHPDYAKRAAVSGMNLVIELVNAGRSAEAEPLAASTRETLERVVADHPDRTENRFYLGYAHTVLAAILLDLGRLDEAHAAAEQGVLRLREARVAMGGHPSPTANLAAAFYQRADVEAAASDLPAALASMDEGLALGVMRPDVVFQGAETFARIARRARDAALPPAERDALRARAEELALRELRSAIDQGFEDFERVRTSEEWELVRLRPEYAELEASRAP
jgi:eukaryotic-like serine/threonine-protein kinase